MNYLFKSNHYKSTLNRLMTLNMKESTKITHLINSNSMRFSENYSAFAKKVGNTNENMVFNKFAKVHKTNVFDDNTFSLDQNQFFHKKKRNSQPLFHDLYSFEQSLPQIKNYKSDLKGKELLKKINDEYYAEILEEHKTNDKKYMPRFGDKVELEYYYSLSSKKFNRFNGIIIGVDKVNTHNFNFSFYFQLEGYYFILQFSYYSPIIKSLTLLSESRMPENQTKLINFKKQIHLGHKGGLVLHGGKKVNYTKKDILNLKEELKTKKDQEISTDSTIFDL